MPSTISETFFIAATVRRSFSRGPSPGSSAGEGVRSSSCSRRAAGISPKPPFTARLASMPGHEQAVDFVGAFEDPVHAGIAVMPLRGVVPDEAVSAVNLHVFVEHEVEHLARRDLEDRRFDRELLERGQHGSALVAALQHAVDQATGPVKHRLDRVFLNRHLGELVADGAERPDRLTELLTRGCVAGCLRDRQLGPAAAGWQPA